MLTIKSRFYLGIGFFVLLLLNMYPAGAALTGSDSCPGCGMIWKDTCIPFEQNNETAYNEQILAASAPIAANQTPVPDFSSLSWSEAFRATNNLFKERYAFSDWRAVDWDTLYATHAPAIADAEKKQDKAAYYRALKGYLFSIPDGHVDILPATGDFGAKYADIGGGFGIAVSRLDSGKVIVSYVANGSAAQRAGIMPGDEVIAWNGHEIHDAINATPYIWSVKKPSTAEGILLNKQRFLTRAPVGTVAKVSLAGNSNDKSQVVNLTAFDDGYDSLIKTSAFLGRQINDIGVEHSWEDIKPQLSNDTVTYRILPNGYAYLAIYGESYGVYQPFKAAMEEIVANKTPGVVIDLRFNSGGDDNIASCFAGWFVDKPAFYEYATEYDPGSRKFTVLSEAWTQPRPNGYHGPVAVLVSPDTISSGEGVPMIFTQTGRGTIISWYGTNGAFGMNTVGAIMPLGQYLFFPNGASLDQNGVIQVDSNDSLVGGIVPHIRVPLNEETVARSMAGEDVQMTYALNWLESQQNPDTPVVPAPTTQKSSPGIAIAILGIGLLVLFAGRK